MNLAAACPPSRQGLATRAQLAQAGISRSRLQRALSAKELVRVRRGVYATQPLPARGEHLLSGGLLDRGYLAEVRAAQLELGDRAVAAGRTAALLWAFDLAVEPEKVELAVPLDGPRGRDGIEVTRHTEVDSVPLALGGLEPVLATGAVQTVLDCARTLPLHEAVVVADSALRQRSVTRKQLVRAAAALRGPGSRTARRVVALSDPRSGSVLESLLRVLLVTHGISRPTTQYTIRDGDRVFVVDLCWPGLRLVVECDGRRWHDPQDARDADRRRDNALERMSWRLLRFTWAEVVHDPDDVLAHVRACLSGWGSAA